MKKQLADFFRAQGLSPRELDVVRIAVHGQRNVDIAVQLGLNEKTVRDHLGHIYKKISVKNKSEFLVKCWHVSERANVESQ